MSRPTIPFRVRDRREKGWFYLDNEYLNGYAKIFGGIGTSIYVSLCRHADNETQECFPSMKLIGEELSISRNTIAKYIALFEKYHLIAIERAKDEKGKWKNNTYFLLDKSEWISHAQHLGTETHAQPLSEPRTTVDKTHAQQLGNKDTQRELDSSKDTTAPSAEGTREVINLFKELNPSYALLFKRKPQHDAAQRLIDREGFDRVKGAVAFVVAHRSDRFCPRIKSPYELEARWADLETYGITLKTPLKRVQKII